MKRLRALLCGVVVLVGLTAQSTTPAAPSASAPHPIVAMRRLTETQYRNTIADIFGPDIVVSGRFEPIVRPQHQLIATGAADAAISPAGLEQFDVMARTIAAQVFDAKHQSAFLRCAITDAACARTTLAPIGRYLFRRPLTSAEAENYANMALRGAEKSASFTKGLELALAAMLIAPDYLYVIESAERDPANPRQMRLDGASRAARLSFMLWNSTPNEPLLKAAEAGTLLDQAGLEAMARHMIASPRFEGGIRAFFADMLLFEKFEAIAKDPVVYPRFNAEVAAALPEQMLRMISGLLVTQKSDYRDIFTSRQTMMSRVLGQVYQVPVRSTTGWEPFTFAADDDRAGILGQAGFLALYAHSGRSSPTLRGRAIRELLMCQPVPNPPGNVNFTAVQDITSRVRPTARHRLAAHATDPACASCHKITDPIGLSLEKFDGIGAWRGKENGADIDVKAQFDAVDISGAAGLGAALAKDPAATQCVANRAFEYATARATEGQSAALAALDKDFAGNGYRIAALFYRVATMPEAWRIPALSAGARP